MSAARERAEQIAREVAHVLPFPRRMVRSAEGGWALVWNVPGRYADIEVFDTGEVLAGLTDYKGRPEVFDVAEVGVGEAAARIRAFLDAG